MMTGIRAIDRSVAILLNCGGKGGTPGPCDVVPDALPTAVPVKKPKPTTKAKKPTKKELRKADAEEGAKLLAERRARSELENKADEIRSKMREQIEGKEDRSIVAGLQAELATIRTKLGRDNDRSWARI